MEYEEFIRNKTSAEVKTKKIVAELMLKPDGFTAHDVVTQLNNKLTKEELVILSADKTLAFIKKLMDKDKHGAPDDLAFQ